MQFSRAFAAAFMPKREKATEYKQKSPRGEPIEAPKIQEPPDISSPRPAVHRAPDSIAKRRFKRAANVIITTLKFRASMEEGKRVAANANIAGIPQLRAQRKIKQYKQRLAKKEERERKAGDKRAGELLGTSPEDIDMASARISLRSPAPPRDRSASTLLAKQDTSTSAASNSASEGRGEDGAGKKSPWKFKQAVMSIISANRRNGTTNQNNQIGSANRLLYLRAQHRIAQYERRLKQKQESGGGPAASGRPLSGRPRGRPATSGSEGRPATSEGSAGPGARPGSSSGHLPAPPAPPSEAGRGGGPTGLKHRPLQNLGQHRIRAMSKRRLTAGKQPAAVPAANASRHAPAEALGPVVPPGRQGGGAGKNLGSSTDKAASIEAWTETAEPLVAAAARHAHLHSDAYSARRPADQAGGPGGNRGITGRIRAFVRRVSEPEIQMLVRKKMSISDYIADGTMPIAAAPIIQQPFSSALSMEEEPASKMPPQVPNHVGVSDQRSSPFDRPSATLRYNGSLSGDRAALSPTDEGLLPTTSGASPVSPSHATWSGEGKGRSGSRRSTDRITPGVSTSGGDPSSPSGRRGAAAPRGSGDVEGSPLRALQLQEQWQLLKSRGFSPFQDDALLTDPRRNMDPLLSQFKLPPIKRSASHQTIARGGRAEVAEVTEGKAVSANVSFARTLSHSSTAGASDNLDDHSAESLPSIK